MNTNDLFFTGLGQGVFSTSISEVPENTSSDISIKVVFWTTLLILGGYAAFQYFKTGSVGLPWDEKKSETSIKTLDWGFKAKEN